VIFCIGRPFARGLLLLRPRRTGEFIACGNSTSGLRTKPDAPGSDRADPLGNKERMEVMFKTIVWATDGSELADGALEHVRELARLHNSRIVAVHANELLRGRAGGAPLLADEPELEEKIAKQIEELRSVGIDATLTIRTGTKDVPTLIADAADEVDADLIVVATHGHGGFKAAIIGSVARALTHTAGRPVLVVPPPKATKAAFIKDEHLATV
jgi:nucleotide-binding universal stress UspA family protein